MSASYLATIEDLAGKRRALEDVIIALANLAGVNAAPYLGRPAVATDDEVDTVVEKPRAIAKKKAPPSPRPQSPAPPVTNEAGPHDKVLHALRGGPLPPIAIRELTGIKIWTLPDVMARLLAAKKVTKSGSRRSLTYELA